jgi:hypothetical protein
VDVKVRIGEVVLHGFDPRSRHAIGDALRDELARLFATTPFSPPRGEQVPKADQESVARTIALAIYREVTR